MTSIAVISDIHGNVPALEAVLADLDRQAPDEVLVGGDLVGRGPEGSAVTRRIASRGWRGVRGNHEDYLLAFRRGQVPEAWWERDEWAAARWMAAELDAGDAERLAALPLTLRSALEPDLTLVHGSPRSNDEGLGPWSSDGEVADHLARVDGRLLVCAHTHRPMRRRVRGGEVVNVGSVGLPFNGDRRAQYAIFHRADGRWRIDFRRVEYDVGATLDAYERSGFRRRGGVTAELLRRELLTAAPHLVPFLAWAEAEGREPRIAAIDAFLGEYQPGEPLGPFFRRLRASSAAR